MLEREIACYIGDTEPWKCAVNTHGAVTHGSGCAVKLACYSLRYVETTKCNHKYVKNTVYRV